MRRAYAPLFVSVRKEHCFIYCFLGSDTANPPATVPIALAYCIRADIFDAPHLLDTLLHPNMDTASSHASAAVPP